MINKKRMAAALSYDKSKIASPKMTALGQGLTAEHIIKKANEHQVPIVEDPSLVDMLSELHVNETIPEELYQVVAEVFAYIYSLDKKSK